MKRTALLFSVLVALSGQAPAASPAPQREIVYQFGYNTKAASSGQGTGTTTVDILGPAADGGVMISGTDSWWNSVRPRATNTCELYPTGGVACTAAPYALSPMQLTIFPLLARKYFNGLTAAGTNTWTHEYEVKAAILPGASGFAGQLYTWQCSYTLVGEGPIAGGNGTVLVTTTGTLNQQGGRYLKATSKQRIAYDPVAKIPVAVSDVRTHFPQRSVYNNDLISLTLLKDSGVRH